MASELARPVYPKDPTAPICACFGLTRHDIEQDVAEGVVTRTKAVLEKAKSSQARCASWPPMENLALPTSRNTTWSAAIEREKPSREIHCELTAMAEGRQVVVRPEETDKIRANPGIGWDTCHVTLRPTWLATS